jgi:hypothetical protein
LNGDWLRKPRAGESRNISHGHPGEVKEILKESGDDSFGLRRHVAELKSADASAHSKAPAEFSNAGRSSLACALF